MHRVRGAWGGVLSLLAEIDVPIAREKRREMKKQKNQFQRNGVNELRGGERRLVGAMVTLGCGHETTLFAL